MNLFDNQRKQHLNVEGPLATRMRPKTFDEFVGQEHIVGEGKILKNSIDADQVPSMVLWGPSGSGKTTLALLIAKTTQSNFTQVSGVATSVSDLRLIIQKAQDRLGMNNERTILFIDEIHRLNKSQQDSILPYVEDGTVIFIGATTENPSFEVIGPLLSRSRVYKLTPLTEEQIGTLIDRAIVGQNQQHKLFQISIQKDAKRFLATASNGDARMALNTVELATSAITNNDENNRVITIEILKDAMQHVPISYDKTNDLHYDTISAYIKSVRGSDPDAAIYWLSRMIEAGEDPLFIMRRIVILAAEDIGMADPNALLMAVAAQQAVHFIGMPEGAIPMAEATVYLATAPKSNSAYLALQKSLEDVRNIWKEPVPLHLRNATTHLMREYGYGQNYKYAHSYPEHFSGQVNLPNNLKDRIYYYPSNQGYEKSVADRIKKWWGERKDQNIPPGSPRIS